MKTIKKNLLLLMALPSLMMCIFASCESMMDIHKDYLKDGEIVYLPKPLSVSFRAGRDQVVAEVVLYNSPNVKTVDISWYNGRRDTTQITPVSASTGLDTLFIPITGLEEKAYTFTMVTTDADGNHSLPFTETGAAYGALFQSSLANQPIAKIDITEDGGQITWTPTLDYLLCSEIRYVTGSGGTASVTVPAGFAAALPDATAGTKVTYRSLFLPELTAIDTFYTAWVEYATAFPAMILLSKSRMQVLALSDETPSAVHWGDPTIPGKNCILDDERKTFWSSQWDGTPPGLPHWALIDLGVSRNIVRIEVTRRSGDWGVNFYLPDTKTVVYYMSDAITDNPVYATYGNPDSDDRFTKLGEVEFENDQNVITKTTDFAGTVGGRYLLLYLPDAHGGQHYTSIADLVIYSN
jgi:hypothetical protein